MKVKVSVKQKNIKENIEQILCDDVCEIKINGHKTTFTYKEKKPYIGNVTVDADIHGCKIKRIAENTTTLQLIENKKTKGIVESVYGTFDVDIYTHKYFKKEELIAVEYDILNQGEIIDSYRLMIKFKKLN